MADEFDIRPAAEADLPGVLALYAQPEMDDGHVLALEDARAAFARFALYPDYTLYVAVADRIVVGTFALLVMDNLGHMGTPSAVIENVMVAPDRHGLGIGQAMMRRALHIAALKGCRKATLSSNMKRTRAHAFYDQLGFARHGYSFQAALDPAAGDGGST